MTMTFAEWWAKRTKGTLLFSASERVVANEAWNAAKRDALESVHADDAASQQQLPEKITYKEAFLAALTGYCADPNCTKAAVVCMSHEVAREVMEQQEEK